MIGIKAHYITSDFIPHFRLLGLLPVDGISQTGLFIHDAVLGLIEQHFPGEHSLISASVTDRGSNYSNASNNFGEPWNCVDHLTNLAVNDILHQNQEISSLISSVKSVVVHISVSSTLRAKLYAHQHEKVHFIFSYITNV